MGHRATGRACLSARLQPAACTRLEGTVTVIIRPGEASLDDWRAIWRGEALAVDPSSRVAVAAGAAAVERILARGEPVYGINTGFGKLAGVRIAPEDLAQLQRNIVLSHAAGVGETASVATTRLMMALKLGSLAQGASGVQPQTLALLCGRVGRSGAARPYGGGDDRRWRGSCGRSRVACRRRARGSWPRAYRA